MTQRVLEIFVTVCEKMSMTLAAQELFISQSAVSHAIRMAEEECGVDLFLRKSGKLQLTPYGKRMLAYSRHILDHFSKITEEVQFADLEKRTIRIACSPDVAEYLMFDLLEEYQALDNSHNVFLSSYITDQMDVFLLRHELDLAITEDLLETPGLDFVPLFRDSMLYACRKDSRFLRPLPSRRESRSFPKRLWKASRSICTTATLTLSSRRIISIPLRGWSSSPPEALTTPPLWRPRSARIWASA